MVVQLRRFRRLTQTLFLGQVWYSYSLVWFLFRYNQTLAMTRYYKKPILLIEFDQNKSFSLQVLLYFLLFHHVITLPYNQYTHVILIHFLFNFVFIESFKRMNFLHIQLCLDVYNLHLSFQTKSSMGSEISIQNVSSKLTLLTIHFPKVYYVSFGKV